MPDHRQHQIEEVTCREFVELVTDYLEDALPADRLELVEEHLVMCDWCKTYLGQMESVIEAIPASRADQPVPEATERVLLAAFRDWRARQ